MFTGKPFGPKITTLLDEGTCEWWWNIGHEYRAGFNLRSHLIAAGAVLRSRIPEDEMSSTRTYEYGFSIENSDLDAIGRVLGMELILHAHTWANEIFVGQLVVHYSWWGPLRRLARARAQ